MFYSDAVWKGRVIRIALGRRQRGREIRPRSGSRDRLARAISGIDGIRREVMHACAGALVDVSHGTSALEGPFAGCRHGAVDTEGTCRGRYDDAGRSAIEQQRNLDYDGHVLLSRAVIEIRKVLSAGNRTRRGIGRPIGIHIGPVKHSEAAGGGGIDRCTVCVVDGQPPQFADRGIGRIDKTWRRRRLKSGNSQSSGQQIV